MDEQQKKRSILDAAKWPLILLAIMWLLEILESVMGIDLGTYGVLPRYASGLKGIITAPLIHGSFGHLLNNSIPFLVGATIISYFYRRIATGVIIMIWLLTGFLVWVFAKPAFHIGASGVVYGMISFVFWAGIFNRDRQSIVLSLIILFVYSGMFYGILPNQPGVSWESHLLGGMVGILAAFLFRSPRQDEDTWEDEDLWRDDTSQRNYFDQETFYRYRD